jgi:hypothetical protein
LWGSDGEAYWVVVLVRGIFGHKMKEQTKNEKKLHNEKFHDMYS